MFKKKKRMKRILVEFGIITGLGIIISFLISPKSYLELQPDWWKVAVISLAYTYGLGYTCAYLMPRLSRTRFLQSRPVTKFIFNLVILAVIVYLVAVIIFYLCMLALYDHTNEWLTLGFVFKNAQISLYIAMAISLFFSSIEFLKSYRNEAVRAEKLEKEKINAQFESLKSQVNPHFLFNSLNALSSLIYEDKELAVKYVRQLSEVYRYVLDARSKDLVPLPEELDFLRSYLFLQKMRFGDNLTVEIRLDQPNRQLIPPLTLQVLVENAIKHNEISSEFPLAVSIYQKKGKLVVENQVRPKTIIDKGMGVGLKNIIARYRLFSDKSIEITRENDLFRIRIPILECEP